MPESKKRRSSCEIQKSIALAGSHFIIIIIIIITALHTNNGECCEMIRRCRVVV